MANQIPHKTSEKILPGSDQSMQSVAGPSRDNDHGRNTFVTREGYLQMFATKLAEQVFSPAGYAVPSNIRFSCSWPSRGGTAKKKVVIGQTWDATQATDGYLSIYISPRIDDPLQVGVVLCHELVHVVAGLECGHRGKFRECALAIGFEGKMTSTAAGRALMSKFSEIIEGLGPYPHGAVLPLDGSKDGPKTTAKKPQKARLIKAECSVCGLTFRAARKWIENKKLTCPDMHCAGHGKPLIFDERTFKRPTVPSKAQGESK